MDSCRARAETIKFRLRMEADMSLRDVARRLDCDPSTVSQVLAGKRKSRRILKEIADLLSEDRASFMNLFAETDRGDAA